MRDEKDITIVDTRGKVLKLGTQGLRVVSEGLAFPYNKLHILDISESSDDSVVNVFFEMAESRAFNSTPDSSIQGMLPPKFEFLLPR